MLGFDGFEIPPELRSLAREFDLGGVVLFKRNVESPEQVAGLAFDARPPLRVGAGLGGRGSGGRAGGPNAAALHRVAADGRPRAERRRGAG